MQIQINTGRHIEKTDQLRATVEDIVSRNLDRFGERVTRVEVHLTDVNADKGGRDTRCVMEARLAGLKPVMVDELAHTYDVAVREAAGKLQRALATRLGRRGRQ